MRTRQVDSLDLWELEGQSPDVGLSATNATSSFTVEDGGPVHCGHNERDAHGLFKEEMILADCTGRTA